MRKHLGGLPRRRKADGEVWHKHKGPHAKAKHFVLCTKCKKGFTREWFRRHVRMCLGFRKCLVCELPFPCETKYCPWRYPAPPTIPPEHVDYFRRTGAENTDDPTWISKERAAIRWYRKIMEACFE